MELAIKGELQFLGPFDRRFSELLATGRNRACARRLRQAAAGAEAREEQGRLRNKRRLEAADTGRMRCEYPEGLPKHVKESRLCLFAP